ncbi:MAG: Tim44/TimA family putative adaptor protein [Holosporaceae bacterium]|jgi:predicted lipid-binding transport protein (Tim44 family)|nr:Tim44/TimA family putative adaptor protein [Holosporaceae bacterium]
MLGLFFFALITFFLMAKLNEILGFRTGFHIKKENLYNPNENSIRETTISEMDKKISQIKEVYPAFDVDDFLKKSQKAFEIIFSAYSSGDVKTLKDLLSPRIFQAFSMAVEDRKKRRETLEGILVRFIRAEIIDIASTEEDIFATVRFETEQSNVLKSEDGSILEGNADFVELRTDVWSFSRKKSASDSRWYLYEIKSE